MARCKRYIDTDVYTETKKRIHHIYDLFDSVVVCFSGGKDSLATLHIAWEVAQERGKTHIDVIFRDEELIPDEVINFVDEYRKLPWIKMLWFAVPLASTKYILGVCRDYVQWDPARPFVREKPEWAITLPEGDDRVFDQYTMDSFCAKYFKGKIALLTGIRASESLIRFRASVNKLNENYINAVPDHSIKHVSICKPLFDWEENDIFKYFYDNKIKYCPLYDLQMWSGLGLRVSTPLHAESAKKFDILRSTVPDFYARVIQVFPEMLAHERYYRELDNAAIKEKYAQSTDGIRAWIYENIEDELQLPKALKELDRVVVAMRANPDCYPLPYVLNAFMSGAFKRHILPQKVVK